MFDEYQGEMKLGNPDEETQAQETIVSNDSTSTRPLEDIQSEKNMFQGIKTAYDVVGLSFGDGVDIASRNKAFEKFPDYKDNKEFYDAYADTDVWYRSRDADKVQRQVIDKYVDDGRFMLDENGDVAMADGSPDAVLWLYDTKAIKGALLARHNGFDKQAEEDAYKEEAKAESERLAKEMQGVDLADQIIGTVAGYMFRQETAIEMAGSPAKIVGKGILKTAGKAFVTEGMVGLVGETLREKNIREHMAKQNLDYSLWESTKHILINAGFAGSLRGAGSYMLDGIAMFTKGKSAANGMKFEQLDEADKSLLKMYVDREQRKLTTNSKLHLDLMQKAEDDINKGKKVDVSDFTDIDIETKIPERRDAVSMPDEIVNINTENRVYEDVKSIQDSVEKTMNMKIDEEVLDGMATEKEFNDVIKETIDIDPEIEAELKAIQAEEKRLNSRAEEVKSASEIPLGGSEDETKQSVQNMFKKNTSEKYKNMTKDDVAYLDKQHEEDLQREAETVFAKFGDNLTAGTIAGVDEDENGNLTFDPAKFVAGLGGYTALKQIIKVPAVKKDMRGYFERLFDNLDNNPKFNLLVGKQQAYASDRMTAIAKKHFQDTDDSGFTKEDYLFVNKAARTLENMDKQLKNEGVEQVEESTKSLEQIISELLEDAQVMNGTRGEATDFGTGRKIDLGVDNPPVTHPMPKDKKKAAEELDKIYGAETRIKVEKTIDKTTRDKNFKKWFKGSKVVDSKGKPLVVYHGTDADFSQFKKEKIGDKFGADKHGFFFTTSPDEASVYAKTYIKDFISGRKKATSENGGNIMPVFLNIKNPLVIKTDKMFPTIGTFEKQRATYLLKAFKNKNDGIIVDNGERKFIIVFEPNQIKSINNNGLFSDSDNILKSAITLPIIGIGASSQQEGNK